MILTRALFVVGILVLVVLGGLFYRFASVGKAIQETPSLSVVNLDLEGSLDVNVENIQNLKLVVTPSGLGATAQGYILQLQKSDDGSLSYRLQSDSSPEIVAQELFKGTMGGGEVYLSDFAGDLGDVIPDVAVSYNAPYFRITNLNYKEPEPMQIVVQNQQGAPVQGPFFLTSVDQKMVLFFNVSSSVAPTVTIAWENGTVMPEGTVLDIESGTKPSPESTSAKPLPTIFFAVKKLEWTPTVAGASPLVVTATIGDKTTSKRYVLATGNVLYELKKADMPRVVITRTSNADLVQLTFPATIQFQPFSLPCGTRDLSALSEDALAKIEKFYGYQQSASGNSLSSIRQWKAKIPSEFSLLEKSKGYFLERKAIDGEITLSISCPLSSPIAPPDGTVLSPFPTPSLPSLVKGWNLIGVEGFEPIPVSTLDLKKPPYTMIKLVYSLSNKGVDTTQVVSMLQPGRAYWVKVE